MKGNQRKREGGNDKKDRFNKNNGDNTSSSAFVETAEVTKAFDDRQDYLLVNSIGSIVTATINSGIKYSGLLVACDAQAGQGISIILKYPKIISKNLASQAGTDTESLSETLLIAGKDVVDLELKNVDFSAVQSASDKSKQAHNQRSKTSFKTDVDISKTNGTTKARELQRWTPDEEGATSIHNENLEDSSSNWDQFAVNEKKFGVKSTFDEHFYTTKINKSDPNFENKLKEAERIAKEIESQGTSGNIHLAEERGIIIDDSGMDEEDKYSGVDRRGDELMAALKSNAKPTPPKSSKYIPPTLRNEPHNVDPAIISSVSSKKSFNVNNSNAETTTTTNAQKTKPSKPADAPATSSTVNANSPTKTNKIPLALPNKLEKSIRSHGSTKHGVHTKQNISVDKINFKKKDAQIEEFRNFSQNLKVPYSVPEDMNEKSKKNSNSDLPSNPSLPPKPTPKSPFKSAPNTATPQEQKKSEGTTRSSGARMQSQSHTPSTSPASTRVNTSRRRNNVISFFGSKVPQPDADKKSLFSKNFNFFQKSKETYDAKLAAAKKQETKSTEQDSKSEAKSMEPFFIEKPYFTTPTWESTIDQSYKTLFPDERSIIQKAQIRLQQRHMKSMNVAAANNQMGGGMGNMMRFQMDAQGSPGQVVANMAGGSMGMYMPFQPQPMFYPGMPQMMGVIGGNDDGHSPQATPQFQPGYMNGNPSNIPMGQFAYPAPMPFQMMVGNDGQGQGNNRGYRNNYHNNHRHGHNNYNHNNYNHHHNNGSSHSNSNSNSGSGSRH